MKALTILLGVLLVASGCSTSSSSKSAPQVRSETVVLPPGASPTSLSAVWISDEVKVYPIGRYKDPADPNIMHERHVVYRREQMGDWQLQVPAERQILIGNTMADGDQSLKPALLEQELGRELQRQRGLMTIGNQNATFMLEKGAQLAESSQDLVQQSQELRRLLEQKEKENQKLQSEIEGEKARRRQQEQNSAIDPATGLPRSGI